MEYDIKEEKYKIEIKGNPDEIRKFIIALDLVVLGNSEKRSSDLEKCLNDLNNISDLKQFYFNDREMICFNNNLIKYMVPSDKISVGFYYFPKLRKHFEDTIKLIKKLKKQKIYDKLRLYIPD